MICGMLGTICVMRGMMRVTLVMTTTIIITTTIITTSTIIITTTNTHRHRHQQYGSAAMG